MQYEIQAYVASIWPADKDMAEQVVKAAKALEMTLNEAGLGFVIEVRDVRSFQSVYKTMQACAPERPTDGTGP